MVMQEYFLLPSIFIYDLKYNNTTFILNKNIIVNNVYTVFIIRNLTNISIRFYDKNQNRIANYFIPNESSYVRIQNKTSFQTLSYY